MFESAITRDLRAALGDTAVAHRRLLDTIAAHDRTQAWADVSMRSEEDFLRRNAEVSWRTAREWVRCARLIANYPDVGDQYETGTISIDKLRALAEVVQCESPASLNPQSPFEDDDDDSEPAGEAVMSGDEVAGMAAGMTVKELEIRAARARAAAADDEARARIQQAHVRYHTGEGRLTISRAEFFGVDAAIVGAAIEDYIGRTKPNPDTGVRDPIPHINARAFVEFANAYLADREHHTAHPMIAFHADPRTLTDTSWAAASDHSPIQLDALRRLACFSRLDLVLDDPAGNPLMMGRGRRLANWQQETMVLWRDGGCRICEATVGIQVHHIAEFGAQHGKTDIDNLIGACHSCHPLLHGKGWRIEGDPHDQIRVIDPTGRTVNTTRPHPRYHQQTKPPPGWLRHVPDIDADVEDCDTPRAGQQANRLPSGTTPNPEPPPPDATRHRHRHAPPVTHAHPHLHNFIDILTSRPTGITPEGDCDVGRPGQALRTSGRDRPTA